MSISITCFEKLLWYSSYVLINLKYIHTALFTFADVTGILWFSGGSFQKSLVAEHDKVMSAKNWNHIKILVDEEIGLMKSICQCGIFFTSRKIIVRRNKNEVLLLFLSYKISLTKCRNKFVELVNSLKII